MLNGKWMNCPRDSTSVYASFSTYTFCTVSQFICIPSFWLTIAFISLPLMS